MSLWSPPQGDRFPRGLRSFPEPESDDDSDDNDDNDDIGEGGEGGEGGGDDDARDDDDDSIDVFCWVDTPFKRRSIVSVPGTVYPATVKRRCRDGRVVVSWVGGEEAVHDASDLTVLPPAPELSRVARVSSSPSRHADHAGKVGIVASNRRGGVVDVLINGHRARFFRGDLLVLPPDESPTVLRVGLYCMHLGASVRVRSTVVDPVYGWGSVRPHDIGTVVGRTETAFRVLFGYTATLMHPDDLEVAKGHESWSRGDTVYLNPSVHRFSCGHLSADLNRMTAGTIKHVLPGGIVAVRFSDRSSTQTLYLRFKEISEKEPGTGNNNTIDDDDNLNSFDPEGAFLCPITKEVLVDPVVCSDGETYERSAILRVMKQAADAGRTAMSPLQRVPISDFIVSNRAVLRHLRALQK